MLLRFRILVKAGLATYFCAATDAARSLLGSTVEEAAAGSSAEQDLGGGGHPGHYFGAATNPARSLLLSAAEGVAAIASGNQRLAGWAVIAGVEGNSPRGQFQVPSPADKDACPSLLKDAAAGAHRGLCKAGRGRGIGHYQAALGGA